VFFFLLLRLAQDIFNAVQSCLHSVMSYFELAVVLSVLKIFAELARTPNIFNSLVFALMVHYSIYSGYRSLISTVPDS
jgi:hypothetical protein